MKKRKCVARPVASTCRPTDILGTRELVAPELGQKRELGGAKGGALPAQQQRLHAREMSRQAESGPGRAWPPTMTAFGETRRAILQRAGERGRERREGAGEDQIRGRRVGESTSIKYGAKAVISGSQYLRGASSSLALVRPTPVLRKPAWTARGCRGASQSQVLSKGKQCPVRCMGSSGLRLVQNA